MEELQHSGGKSVDELFSGTLVTAGEELVSLGFEASSGGIELEGPKEGVGLLEVGSASPDFVDQVFDAVDVEFAQRLGDEAVIVEGDSLSVDLSVSSLVDELSDGGVGGGAESDPRLDLAEHVLSGLVVANEGGVVQLAKSEKSEDLLLLGRDLVKTLDSDNEEDLSLIGHEEVSVFLRLSVGIDQMLGVFLEGLAVRLSLGEVKFLVLLRLFESLGALSLQSS